MERDQQLQEVGDVILGQVPIAEVVNHPAGCLSLTLDIREGAQMASLGGVLVHSQVR